MTPTSQVRPSRLRALAILATFSLGLPWLSAPTAAADPLTLGAALGEALGGNLAILRARHEFAGSQSQLRAAENRYAFKLGTTLSDGRVLRRQRDFLLLPGALRDVADDSQSAGLVLSRETPWGGRFDVSSKLTRSRLHGPDTPLTTPVHEAAWGVSFTQPLVAGRGRRVATADLVSARLGHAREGRALAEDETRLVVAVIAGYHDVIRAGQLIEIDESAARQAEGRLRTSGLRLEEGLITPIDVARAERDLRSRESSLLGAQESRRSAVDALALLLGRAPGDDIEIADAVPYSPVEVNLERAVAEAGEARADLLAAREALELAELGRDVARSNARPRLDLTLGASFTNVAGEEAQKFWDFAPQDDWTAELVFTHVLGERADDEAYLRARIDLDVATLALTELERRVTIEVREAVRGLATLERRIEVLSQGVALAKESFRLATAQYAEALITTTDLLADQDQVVAAETEHVNALLDHAVAAARLDLVLGRYRLTPAGAQSPWLRTERAAKGRATP